MGEGFSAFQDILPQLLDEPTVLSYVAAAPLPLIRRCLFSGTPDEILDQLAAYRDHGVRYPVLLNASPLQTKLSRGLPNTRVRFPSSAPQERNLRTY